MSSNLFFEYAVNTKIKGKTLFNIYSISLRVIEFSEKLVQTFVKGYY
jgi:hypothetical protein